MYEPTVGNDFQVNVHVLETKAALARERARLVITVSLAIIVVVGFLICMWQRVIGVETSSLEVLLCLAATPITTMILGYYFGKSDKPRYEDEDHESSA